KPETRNSKLFLSTQNLRHDRFLHVQSVLSFVDYHGRRRVDHRVSHNYIPTHWQTVHEDRVVSARHLFLVDNPLRSILSTFFDVSLGVSIKLLRTPALGIDY